MIRLGVLGFFAILYLAFWCEYEHEYEVHGCRSLDKDLDSVKARDLYVCMWL